MLFGPKYPEGLSAKDILTPANIGLYAQALPDILKNKVYSVQPKPSDLGLPVYGLTTKSLPIEFQYYPLGNQKDTGFSGENGHVTVLSLLCYSLTNGQDGSDVEKYFDNNFGITRYNKEYFCVYLSNSKVPESVNLDIELINSPTLKTTTGAIDYLVKSGHEIITELKRLGLSS